MATRFFTTDDDRDIVRAIADFESRTSVELRVCLTRHRPADIIHAAKAEFFRLGMQRTEQHNAVLIYLAPKVRRLAIYAGPAVYHTMGHAPFEDIAARLSADLKVAASTGQSAGAAVRSAIASLGTVLAPRFPATGGNPNELPDQVVRD